MKKARIVAGDMMFRKVLTELEKANDCLWTGGNYLNDLPFFCLDKEVLAIEKENFNEVEVKLKELIDLVKIALGEE